MVIVSVPTRYKAPPLVVAMLFVKVLLETIAHFVVLMANAAPFVAVFPSKEQRDWSKFEAPWYNPDAQSEQKDEYWAKIEQFDVSTLRPFDKVLVRDNPEDEWIIGFFSHISGFKKVCDSLSWSFVIPYNDETKHLVGTNEEEPEYYRIW